MSDAEVALELLKLALVKCADAASAAKKKDELLCLYRECLAAVQKQDRA